MDAAGRAMRAATAGEATPATLVTRDFSLAARVQGAGMARIARVIVDPKAGLAPRGADEILLVDASTMADLPASTLTGWCDAFSVVVCLHDSTDGVPTPPPGVLLAEVPAEAGRAGERPSPGGRTTEDDGERAGLARPHTLVLFNPKGGVGKTTLAVALAHRLVAGLGLKTGLLDLDVGGGDVRAHLGLPEGPTLMDAVAYGGDVTPELLRGLITRHGSGIDVLAAPGRRELVELAGTDALLPTLRCMRRMYDALVVDTASGGADFVGPAAIEAADLLLCPVSDDPTSLQRLAPWMGTGSFGDRGRAVLNRFAPASSLRSAQVRATLGIPVLASIPDLGASVSDAIGRGEPVCGAQPDSPIGAAMDAIIGEVYGAAPNRAHRVAWWQVLKRKVWAKGAELLHG